MYFVTLHAMNGVDILVNLEKISTVMPYKDGSKICFAGEEHDYLCVTETFDRLTELVLTVMKRR